ncbi:uroporphyrinogen decarboxylase [Labrys neptuniae]|uniref:uroporphyrinogen decarboxylase n=1 Tax=Labrys neptuniae TaxID=376174 RepID=UPI00288E0099|nr:uroporphyrinogen decarboxylase [Labrys neptuniae]MDT3376716.1 uroporphyrinogen decarboxylase [Labrys neptuniae]
MTKALLDVLAGKAQPVPPIWLMRQAGRYLPEYRAIRTKASGFLNFCYTPDLATEATLQPIRRFGFDAAILFSDILVVPDALGQKVWFEEGEGPRLEPVTDLAGLVGLKSQVDLDHLAPVFETIRQVKATLPANVTFLGFCGAPWTVATYMIAGRGVKDQLPARLAAYQDPVFFAALIDRLVAASIDYLAAQLENGVDAVQIFDSWAGILPPDEFERWAIEPAKRIVEGVRARCPGARIIGFPRGAGSFYCDYARDVAVDAIGLDWAVDPAWAAQEVQPLKPVQGNLDPLALVAGGDPLNLALDRILENLSGKPFIFNLGHGIVPQTPIAHVEQMLKRIRG